MYLSLIGGSGPPPSIPNIVRMNIRSFGMGLLVHFGHISTGFTLNPRLISRQCSHFAIFLRDIVFLCPQMSHSNRAFRTVIYPSVSDGLRDASRSAIEKVSSFAFRESDRPMTDPDEFLIVTPVFGPSDLNSMAHFRFRQRSKSMGTVIFRINSRLRLDTG
jgi:hypothetical protein